MNTKFTFLPASIKLIAFFLLMSTYTIQAQTFTNYTETDGLVNNSVNCLAVAADDVLWFGTQNGVSKFDGTTWISYTEADGLVNNTVFAIAATSDGLIWAGTDFGVSVYDSTSWTTYTEDDGLADNRVKYITEDLDGHVWIGNNDGVSVFDGVDWVSYTMADGLPFGGVNFIGIHPNGDKWLGTSLGGVRIFDGFDFDEITETQGLLNDKVRSIAFQGNNKKWIGTADGISVYDTNNELLTNHTIMFTLPPPDTLNPVEDIQVDGFGRIWAGIYIDYLVTEGGVSMYDGAQWIDYDVADGLIGPVVRRLAIDGDNNVWVATSTGVSRISDVPVNTSELKKSKDFKIYPNPVGNVLNIDQMDVVDFENKTITLYNASMQIISNYELPAGQTILSISTHHLANGIYFVKVGDQVQKVFVSR